MPPLRAAFYAVPMTNAQRAEQGGYICSQKDWIVAGSTSYSFSTPRTDASEMSVQTRTGSSNLYAMVSGRTVVADYHTHPTFPIGVYGNRVSDYNNFSNPDKQSSSQTGLPLYMYNDTGTMKSFQAGQSSKPLYYDKAGQPQGWINGGKDTEASIPGAPPADVLSKSSACKSAGFY